ncbi:zinc-binding dehydrogenase [Phytohabitans sp. ZYX-F-186]|uniref:Zinc-binding dehydrogenase n=1 Tax=Phytohabitans maris TaxID=3071409 RepID=A0ABU0ZXU3_9ACTN|nr:zinc-binding dehydrogenase [Phytohabitans sp. ZYX-F-186]MDQ7911015.1 zinc-binding dehydrogenase [Phytohabitans sp. ZYX-F-186]
MNLNLEYHRSPIRYVASRTATGTIATGRAAGWWAANMSPVRLVNRPDPRPPGPGWTRVKPLLSGICGSDLGLLTGRNSPYLSALISLPFTPGHEVVGETLDPLPDLPKGSRVVLDPVLGCVPRDVKLCPGCAADQHSRCDHITSGTVSAALQTGFCADTGGGWSRMFVAHGSQLHKVPDELDDERAVLVEPLACAIHSVRRVPIPDGASVLVVGAGTVGLFTTLALREYTKAGPIYVIARYGHQRERAREMGATEVLSSDRAARALRRATGGFLARPEQGAEFLLGGTDVAFDCTSGSGLDTALRVVRAGGTVLLSGMPNASVDLTPAWFRELSIVGAYASGGHDFQDAMALAKSAPLTGYVDAVYPLSRWRDAIGHASSSGRLGSIKVAFDPTKDQ